MVQDNNGCMVKSLHTVALTQLSLENFYQSHQQMQHTTIPSSEASLPVDYGRKPLSEEEITFINVSHFCMPFFYCFYHIAGWSQLTEIHKII